MLPSPKNCHALRSAGVPAGLLLLLLIASPAAAQDEILDIPGGDISEAIGDGGISVPDVTDTTGFLKRFSQSWPSDLVIAPVPGRSPQVGWSLALGAGYFLDSGNEDSDVAPSVLGGFAWIAENDSYAYGLGTNLHLYDDLLRVKAGVGYMDIRYSYYGIGDANDRNISVDVLQEAPLYYASASVRVWRKLYVGLGYMGGQVDTRVDLGLDLPDFIDPVVKLDMGALTIPIFYDSRDHEQFPRNGWMIQGRTVLHSKEMGSDFNAETFMLSANKYIPMRESDVLAFRGYFRTTSDGAPFFVQSTFGGKSDLRGYPSGRFRDRMMYALQGEYRWQFNNRWIFTGFAGFGEVASELDEFGEDTLPAAGVGVRFVVSDKHRVALSFDVATGQEGTEYYFGVGESF